MRQSAPWLPALAAILAAMSFFASAQSAPAPPSLGQNAGAASVTAQPTAVNRIERPLWTELTPGQQTVLAPIEKTWDDNDAVRKRKWVELAARYPKMSAEEQANAQKRMADWARMSPSERRATRQNFQAAQKVDAEKRAAKWEAYQALPEEERRKLAEQRAAKSVAPKATAAPAPIPRPMATNPGEPGHHAQQGRREPARLTTAEAARPAKAAVDASTQGGAVNTLAPAPKAP